MSLNLRDLLVRGGHFGDGQFTARYGAERLSDAYLATLHGAEVLATDGGGAFVLGRCAWDSRYLDREVYRIHEWLEATEQDQRRSLSQAITTLRDRGAELVYARTEVSRPDRTHAMTSSKALLCATKVMLSRTTAPDVDRARSRDPRVVPYSQDMQEVVASMAAAALRDNRFANDPNFAPEQVSGIYRAWTEQSLRNPSVIRLVFLVGDEPAGFIAVSVGRPYGVSDLGSYGFVDLVAKDRSIAVRGVGRALVCAAIDELAGRGAGVLFANTMLTNIPAQRLFYETGFTMDRALHEWHWWSE